MVALITVGISAVASITVGISALGFDYWGNYVRDQVI